MRYSTIRRSCVVLGCVLFFVVCIAGASKGFAEKADPATDVQATDEIADVIAKASKMFRKGEYEEALVLIDRAIVGIGESVELLEFKDDLLWKMNRHENRVENMLRLEEVAERKSPWYCLKLAEAYVQLGQNGEAITWLEKAVEERGFRRAAVFESDVYDPIRGDDRFLAVIAKARENMGIGKPVPDISVTLLDGKRLTLSSLRGKVTLLDFWASWCVPCRKEMPNLKKLYRKYNKKGFEIVGISLDADKAKALAYVDENDLRWPMSWSERGYQDEPARLYMINSLPSMWLIDKNGILRYFNVKGDDLRGSIELLLSEASQ